MKVSVKVSAKVPAKVSFNEGFGEGFMASMKIFSNYTGGFYWFSLPDSTQS